MEREGTIASKLTSIVETVTKEGMIAGKHCIDSYGLVSKHTPFA